MRHILLMRLMAPEGDPSGGAPVAAPAAAPAPVVPAAVSAPPGPEAMPSVGEPGWVKARADRAAEKAKKETRKELKNERRAVKTAGEEAKALKLAAETDMSTTKLAVDAILSSIPEAERAAVLKAGGTSVAETLRAFSVWQAAKGSAPVSPAIAAPSAPAPGAPHAAAPLAAPANSAPPGAAPAPAGAAPVGEDHKAVYADLRATNPLLAAQYLLWHTAQIYPDQKLIRK